MFIVEVAGRRSPVLGRVTDFLFNNSDNTESEFGLEGMSDTILTFLHCMLASVCVYSLFPLNVMLIY